MSSENGFEPGWAELWETPPSPGTDGAFLAGRRALRGLGPVLNESCWSGAGVCLHVCVRTRACVRACVRELGLSLSG